MQATVMQTTKQKIFWDMILGILVYAVVLGFFEDYTNIISTWSYSITFFVAIVMQVLTYLTFWLKSKVVNHFKGKEGKKYVAGLVFFVWLIMFFSKFVFLAVIDFIFGNSVEISGFIGLVIIIVVMSLFKKSIDVVYAKLA
jgi:hypothetical protein